LIDTLQKIKWFLFTVQLSGISGKLYCTEHIMEILFTSVTGNI